MEPLGVSFFEQPALEVARALIGLRIESRIAGRITGGRIVETEAYLGADDPASHAFRGRQYPGNRSIYAPPGTWYVYRSYGIHWCANLVAGPEGQGAAVLLRAIAPGPGVEVMRRRRGAVADRQLANGPGKLAQALGISGRLDGVSMPVSRVRVFASEDAPPPAIVATPRIGISKAVDWPCRFVLEGGG